MSTKSSPLTKLEIDGPIIIAFSVLLVLVFVAMLSYFFWRTCVRLTEVRRFPVFRGEKEGDEIPLVVLGVDGPTEF